MEVKSTKQAKSEVQGIQAQVEMWKYALGFTPMAIVNCAIELQIAEVLESHGGSMTLPELSTALGCAPSPLYRIMRYLVHRGIFKQTPARQDSSFSYTQTPLSRLVMKNEVDSMAALILMENTSVMLDPWHRLSARVSINGDSAFEAANGKDVWDYAAENPGHSKLINDAMACRARMDISAIIDQYPEAFKGIRFLVDVGGGNGTTLRALLEAFPWIRGINFDLPYVASVAPYSDGVEHVGGDMFKSVPKADAAILMMVLHDWGDEECIHVLKNCREAIDKETGKVIIVETVIEEGEDHLCTNVRLAIDMVMLAHTNNGKERTLKEWEYVVTAAGFSRCAVERIEAIPYVIEAYP